MKILHTESSPGFGGQELRVLNEMVGMRDRGHEVYLISQAESEIHATAKQYGLSTIALPIGRKKIAGLRALKQWIETHRPDVINTHSSTDTWLVALATRLIKQAPPIVRTRHISASIPKNFSSRWLYTQASQHIVTTGEKLRETLIRENGFPAEHITSQPTGVDFSIFHPAEKHIVRQKLGLSEKEMIIGIVATLRSWKGHRYLIEAFSQLTQNNLQLLIVGDGPQEETLKELVDSSGLSDRVRFTGRQDNVAEWMQALDIFCLPSYANEGVPQALMQSQACGIPAITTQVGSIDEAIVAGQSAMVVETQNSEQIRIQLMKLIEDDSLRQQMGEAAAAHAKQSFSHEIMLDEMTRIFEKVIQTNLQKT